MILTRMKYKFHIRIYLKIQNLTKLKNQYYSKKNNFYYLPIPPSYILIHI